jgi:hypothetical protein
MARDPPVRTEILSSSLPGVVAVIIFQIIDSNLGEKIRVHCLVAQTSCKSSTGKFTRVRIHSEAKTKVVDCVGHGFHALGELGRVGYETVVVAGVAAIAPTVVEDYIVVSEIFQSVVDD